MSKKIRETERLVLREMEDADYDALCEILQDAETMWAYEHAFSDEEVQAWLENQYRRYREDGFGLWAVCRKADGRMIGQCGITWQDWEGRQVPEVGYLLNRAFWHRGYATEAAMACRDYAFAQYGFDEVYSIIRDNNLASQAVARRNGMRPQGSFVKQYHGVEMPHIVFRVRRVEVVEG